MFGHSARLFSRLIFLGIGFAAFLPSAAQAELAELRSTAREIRFGISDHGRSLNLTERKSLRKDLALSYLTLAKLARERRGAGPQTVPPPGRSLVSLATAVQRLIEATPRNGISTTHQAQLERQLAHATALLQSKID